MSSPDRPLDDEELAALEYFVDSALSAGVPSMVRRLLREVRDRRAADAPVLRSEDGWQLQLEDPVALPDHAG